MAKKIDICSGEYAAKWCLSDFYEESEQKLRAVLASGEDFDTGWWGCKKEIDYARICREGGALTVEVSCHMDDLYESEDLIYDALWEECRIKDELPDDIIASITDACIDAGLNDESSAEDALPQWATFEDICVCLERLTGEAVLENKAMYAELRAIVREHVAYMNGEKNGTEE